MARQKPIPVDRYSLPQAYHRWLYQDYVDYWNEQTAVTKQLWETNARPYHMTGFAYWMKYHLSNLPDIAAWWHLDERTGISTIDFSKNSNTGTIHGALHVPGYIDYALEFDGIDDRVNCGHSDSLDITGPITVELLAKPYSLAPTNYQRLFEKYLAYQMNFGPIAQRAVSFFIRVGGAVKSAGTGINVVTWDERHYFAGIFDGSHVILQYDLTVYEGAATAGPIDSKPTSDFIIANYLWHDRAFYGIEDEVIIYNRALSLKTRNRHAQRRYP